MRLSTTVTFFSLAGPILAASSQQPLLFIHPAPASTLETHSPLTAPQANAVLAHHLGVAQFENIPSASRGKKAGDEKWKEALGSEGVWRDQAGPKMVILVEGPNAEEIVPTTIFPLSSAFPLPSLPIRSWASVLALHLHRLVGSLGLDRQQEGQVWGLDALVETIKTFEGWMGWVGSELGNAIGWDQVKKKVHALIEEAIPSSRQLTELDMLEPETAKLVLADLNQMSNLVDSFSVSEMGADDGPQGRGEAPHVVVLHLTSSKHLPANSPASELLRSTLAATISAFTSRSPSEATVLLLSLPPHQQPLLTKRKKWLDPFQVGVAKRYTGSKSSSGLHKRQFDGEESDDEGRRKAAARPTPSPVVPTTSHCFKSLDDLNNQTESCLSRGVGVLGVTVKGGECWVCSCGKTTENGKTKRWAGQGCEKEDLSSPFTLLLFSSAGLIVVLFYSVTLLAGVGSQELPSTLASVSGGLKKD
ncbi:hypothetical protein T439DRAFT_325942 [Meredithblackwellia eburnea MCA 4105]